MPGVLRCGVLDMSSPAIVARVINTVKTIARNASNKYKLATDGFGFNITGGNITSDSGWYIICTEGNMPIYVGKANNLNNRLNTPEGSLDNFAARQRKTDSERNFIKLLLKHNAFKSLYVVVIPKLELEKELKLKTTLNDIDQGNIEKCINIHRGFIL